MSLGSARACCRTHAPAAVAFIPGVVTIRNVVITIGIRVVAAVDTSRIVVIIIIIVVVVGITPCRTLLRAAVCVRVAQRELL
jgi:hypothetical protein